MMAADTQPLLRTLVERVNRVRRRLVLLAVLRTAALAAGGLIVYALLLFAVERLLGLGGVPRAALSGLGVVGGVALLAGLLRVLAGHLSAHRAAGIVDNHFGLQQQLVAAVEYEAQGDGYPYSRALADHLVREVAAGTAKLDFDEAAPRRLTAFWGTLAGLGILIVGLIVWDDFRLLTKAWSYGNGVRAASTQLTAVEGDVVAEPDTPVALTARIEGDLPKEGALVTEPERGGAPERFYVAPTYDADDQPRLEARVTLPAGRYRYRFEAGNARSREHSIAVVALPRITRTVATVTPPSQRVGTPFTRELPEPSLEVFRGSDVALEMTASQPVKAADVTGPGGEGIQADLSKPERVLLRFKAEEEGFLRIKLTGAEGIANDKIPGLQVRLKRDEAPKFKPLSPGDDYLATNVASVPLRFEVTDDMGLQEAALVVEVAGREPVVVPARLEPGAAQATVEHTLELEDYDLAHGDHVLFYATATETDIGLKEKPEQSASDLFFIEIKPYRQIWHQVEPGGPPGSSKEGLDSGRPRHRSLKAILEYQRALLKKTWSLAHKGALSDEDRARLKSMEDDAQFIREQLVLVRDDERYQWTAENGSRLGSAVGSMKAAGVQLAVGNPKGAVEEERDAYEIVRGLLKEFERAMMFGGSGGVPEGPDAVVLEEQAHLARYEKERVKWELKRLAERLDALEEAQQEVKRRFNRFLQEDGQPSQPPQRTTDEKSWQDPDAAEGEEKQQSASQGGSQSEASQGTVEGPIPQSPASGGSSSAPSASRQDQIQMLRARQRALQQETVRLGASLERLPAEALEPGTDNASAAALNEAADRMQALDEALGKEFFDASKAESSLGAARQAMDEAGRALEKAQAALAEQIKRNGGDDPADELERLAKKLARLAERYEQTDDPAERALILKEIEALRDLGVNFNLPKEQIGAWTQLNPGGPYTGPALVTTSQMQEERPPAEDTRFEGPAEVARYTARAYWSRSIETRRQRGELGDVEASDAEFRRFEAQFFEKTAEYGADPGAATGGNAQ